MAGNEAGLGGIEVIAGAADLEALSMLVGVGQATALLAANAFPTVRGYEAADAFGKRCEERQEGAGTVFKQIIKAAFDSLEIDYNSRGVLADRTVEFVEAVEVALAGGPLEEGASLRTRPPLEAVLGLLASWGVSDEADQQAAAVPPAKGSDPDPVEGQGADPAEDAPGPKPEIVLSPPRERYETFLMTLLEKENFTFSDPENAGGALRKLLGFSPNEWAAVNLTLGSGSEKNPGLRLFETQMHSPRRTASYTLLPERIRLFGDTDFIARQVLPELERRMAALEQYAAAK